MVLLDRNWRCEAGEIDLVLRDGPVLVVCEVKTRVVDGLRHAARGGHRRARLDRLRRLAARWLEEHGRPAGRGAHRPGRRAAAARGGAPQSSTCAGVG